MTPYSSLAVYYNTLTQGDCPYAEWAEYLAGIAAKHNVRTVAEFACGTGKMTALLCGRGFKVVASDISAEMLNEARRSCPSPNALFVQQDMRHLQLTRAADMAVCVNDGVNYLKPAELAPFFQKVAANLVPGGPFVFDVSSAHKLRHTLGNNVFFWDGDGQTLLWSNKLQRDSVRMDLVLFVAEGQLYRRFDECHVQHIHTQQQLCAALEQAGFGVEQVSEGYGHPLTQHSQRITIYATRR